MPGAFAGHYLDGRSAARQPATIRLTATGLDIALESGATLWWPFAEVRQTQGFYAGQQIRLERGAPLAAVLLVDDFGFLAALHTAAPVLTRRFHDPRRRRARVQLTVLAALAVVGVAAALYVWGIPAAAGAVAARVPASWEERLGNAIVADLASSGRQCVDPEREAVIGGIVRRLLAPLPSVPYTFRVTVLDDGSVNALAVPGGQIILLRGLLERTRTPEELAGVLAHEIQHVLRRHATRMLLQHTSAGLMLAAVSGDISGAMAYGLESARVLGALRYSRQYEAEADVQGLRMLLAAGVDPEGMIAFFETLRAEEGRRPTPLRYLASHPPAGDRMETLKRLAATAPHRSAPLLPDRDWRDVATLCAGGSR